MKTLLSAASTCNPFYARKLASLPLRELFSEESLPALLRFLPFTTKEELQADQAAHPPYGTNLSSDLRCYVRLHQTSGTSTGSPLRWLDTAESWNWMIHCWQIIYDIVGLKAEDRVFFPFSFGPFIGFWAAFEGAARRGVMVLPGGGMNSLARLRFLQENAVTVVCCTPTYALRLAEVARDNGIHLADSSVRMLIVAGEPGGSVPSTRQRIESAWGARVFDHCGMTEVGSFGIECPDNPGGMHVLETEFIPEVVDAEGIPVPPGQEGELVITNLGRLGSPLIRYRTGDRVIADPEPCPCGRPWMRLRGGILGRTDDMLVVRGNNVYPSALENIIRRFDAVEEFLIEVCEAEPGPALRLRLECRPHEDVSRIVDQIQQAVRSELHFRPDVEAVPCGTLPRSEMKSRRVVRKLATDVLTARKSSPPAS
ncbi:MAG: AMP-binding protein [Gemmatales bacterium]|nr:AMP-binding protein [Gemmatales bacterium]MDW8386990.1 AMP-binding protein [Gemmatales bacterium]